MMPYFRDTGWLKCPRCGRGALEPEWPEVTHDIDGLDPRRCPDCHKEGYHVRPVPAAEIRVRTDTGGEATAWTRYARPGEIEPSPDRRMLPVEAVVVEGRDGRVTGVALFADALEAVEFQHRRGGVVIMVEKIRDLRK